LRQGGNLPFTIRSIFLRVWNRIADSPLTPR
jgi:hypothetical protein